MADAAKICKYNVYAAKICKHALFVVKICKHVFFVAKFCNRALDERFCWTFCGAQKAANFCHPVEGFSDHRNNSFWKDHLLVFYPITVIILVVDIQDAIIVVIQVVHIIAGNYDVFYSFCNTETFKAYKRPSPSESLVRSLPQKTKPGSGKGGNEREYLKL